MSTEFLQSYDPTIAAFNTANLHTCRLIVPFVHKLVSAYLVTTNVVHTGTVTAALRQSDHLDTYSGALVGTALNNTTLGAETSKTTKIEIALADADKQVAPAFRCYHLTLTATDAADRINHPLLLIEVERVTT
jgi:N-formylglutamate amidohydrolase